MHRTCPLAVLVACAASPPPARPSPPAPGTAGPGYVLLAPTAEPARDGLPVLRPLAATDPQRAEIEAVLARPFLRWVLAVGDEAKRRARARCGADAACARRFDQPAYFLIVKDGNRPHQGFVLGDTPLPDAWYVEIDPAQASILIPHEYGHVMMFESLPGDLPQLPQTLPHTTAAITNPVVAFSEGWGIHFETLAGDQRDEVEGYARWHHDAFATAGPIADGDSFGAVTDLFSYAQTYRRYTAIKENAFAYLPRPLEAYVRDVPPTGADVVARWTDSTVDPARIRSLPQMVASEGVIAALFYRLATAPGTAGGLPDPARYAAMFDAFAQVTEERARDTPPVLVFLAALLEQAAPAERQRIARTALEVFHFTLAVPDSPRLYQDLHAAGHQVDKPVFKQRLAAATPALERAVADLVANPASLATLAVPAVWLLDDAVRIDLPVLGMRQRALVLDLDSAPVELLMAIPGVTYAEAVAIDTARRARPFRSAADLAGAPNVRASTVEAVRAMEAAFVAADR